MTWRTLIHKNPFIDITAFPILCYYSYANIPCVGNPNLPFPLHSEKKGAFSSLFVLSDTCSVDLLCELMKQLNHVFCHAKTCNPQILQMASTEFFTWANRQNLSLILGTWKIRTKYRTIRKRQG